MPCCSTTEGRAEMELPEDVVVRRSARRRRTLQARRDGDKIVVLVPATLAARDYERLVPQLIERVRAREAGGKRRSDAALEQAACLLYTSDAADDLLCVDLGGR